MKKIIPILFMLTACTYSINLAHTEGEASDVIDDTQEASPTVSPKLTIPFTNGPSAPANYARDMPKNLTGPVGS